jgi:hypothetical protein
VGQHFQWDGMSKDLYLREGEMNHAWGLVSYKPEVSVAEVSVAASSEIQELDARPDLEALLTAGWRQIIYKPIENRLDRSTFAMGTVDDNKVFFYSSEQDGILRVSHLDPSVSDPHMNGFEVLN